MKSRGLVFLARLDEVQEELLDYPSISVRVGLGVILDFADINFVACFVSASRAKDWFIMFGCCGTFNP